MLNKQHNNKLNKQQGFTIVELLIVIVVIAILAAISIVAYNGIQTRAENSKTATAVSSWAKALQMYKIDKGNYPPINTCLGDLGTYTSSFNGVCWGVSSSTVWVVQPTFLTVMKDYVGTAASPSSKNVNTDIDQFRGAMYYATSGGGEEVRVTFIGASNNLADCTSISGLNSPYALTSWSNGRSCYYKLPQ